MADTRQGHFQRLIVNYSRCVFFTVTTVAPILQMRDGYAGHTYKAININHYEITTTLYANSSSTITTTTKTANAGQL